MLIIRFVVAVAAKTSRADLHVQEPQLVIDAVKQVVEAARNPSTWTNAP